MFKTAEMTVKLKRNPQHCPHHHTQQHCVCCGNLQASGIHNLSDYSQRQETSLQTHHTLDTACHFSPSVGAREQNNQTQ